MSRFKQNVLGSVQHSVFLTSLAFALDNVLAVANLNAADPAPSEHLSGANIKGDLEYARDIAERYLALGKIKGKVAEIGPGGSAAVALHLLAEGCDSVDLIDRFKFGHNPERLTAVYHEIIRNDPRLFTRFESSSELSPNINFYTGPDAAAEVFFRKHKDYDAILSAAVLEHLYDPIEALKAMASALTPEGALIHIVDLRDHGMFSAGGHHELTLLTIPSWFYPYMSRRRGRPNRVLINRYREALQSLEMDFEILVNELVGVGPVQPAPYDRIPAELRQRAEADVEEFRPRLATEFRGLPARDLAIRVISLVARRKG